MANKSKKGIGALMQIAWYYQEAAQLVARAGYKSVVDTEPALESFGDAVVEIVTKHSDEVQPSWQSSDPKKRDWDNDHSMVVFEYSGIRFSASVGLLFHRGLDKKVRDIMESQQIREFVVFDGSRGMSPIQTPVGRIYTQYTWGHHTALTYYQMPLSSGRSRGDWQLLRAQKKVRLTRSELAEYLSNSGIMSFRPDSGHTLGQLREWLVELTPAAAGWSFREEGNELVFSATKKLGEKNYKLLTALAEEVKGSQEPMQTVLDRMIQIVEAVHQLRSVSIYEFTCSNCGGSPEAPSYSLSGFDGDLLVYINVPAWLALAIDARLGIIVPGNCGCDECEPLLEE